MPAPDSAASELSPCPILHQDRFLILVNKPAGVLSHPNSARATPTERAAFTGDYDLVEKTFTGPSGRVWLLHRLDQDTSGVLLAALDAATAERCRQAFEAGAVRKTYLALVRGTLAPSDTWLDHLAVAKGRGQVRACVIKGRPPNAELRYRLMGHNSRARLSLLEINLITGRTHQIRVQAASRQHPLAGDDVYGDFGMNRRLRGELGLRRLFLHAARLEFKHPASGQALSITAPLPEDISAVCDSLGFKV